MYTAKKILLLIVQSTQPVCIYSQPVDALNLQSAISVFHCVEKCFPFLEADLKLVSQWIFVE